MSLFISAPSFAEAYEELLSTCFKKPEFVCRPRGMEVRELISPAIRVTNPLDRFYRSPGRSTPMRYLAGEFVWYFTGRNDPEFISKYSAFWNMLKNPQGSPLMEAGKVNSSYGHLVLGVADAVWEGSQVTQWDWAMRSLRKDPDTRQAIVHVNRPAHQHDWVKDFPCTIDMQFLIRRDQLHLVVNMRSNDLIKGLTFDFPMFSFFQETALYHLRELEEFEGLELGGLTLTATSSHIYERDYETVEKMLSGSGIQRMDPVSPLGVPPVIYNWGPISGGRSNIAWSWALSDLNRIANGDMCPSVFEAGNSVPDQPTPVYQAMAAALAA